MKIVRIHKGFEGNLQEFNKDFERRLAWIERHSGLWEEIGKLLYFGRVGKCCGRILKAFCKGSGRIPEGF